MLSVWEFFWDVGTWQAAETGSFAVSGNAAPLTPAVVGAVGGYTDTGIAAILNTSLVGAVQSYTFTGIASTFNTSLVGAVQTYTLTGNAAPLTPAVVGAVQSYALTGIATIFNTSVLGAVQTYALTGISTILNITLTSDVGAYVLTGIDATLTASGQSVTMAADTVAFILNGLDAALIAGGQTPETGPNPGGATTAGYFSKKKWHDLLELIAAEKAAEAKAKGLKPSVAKKTLVEAARVTAGIIANIESGKEYLPVIEPLTAALEAAASATRLSDVLSKAKAALRIAKQLQDDEEEEEAIMLLTLH